MGDFFMTWRLGLDLGTNSLGWAALKLELQENIYRPNGLIASGVRIFSDSRHPITKISNAAARRGPRGARKNRDRYLRRKANLMQVLIEFGLMPEDEAARKALHQENNHNLHETDPWMLRARGLDEQLTPYQLGRAIFHLHQRRGFKSNRKTDGADKEKGKVYDATKRTIEQLEDAGARTLGELFGRPRLDTWRENQQKKHGERTAQPLARVRKSGEGAKWQYEYYPTRDLIGKEFDVLWQAQKGFHPDILTDEAHARIRNRIIWQHELKPQPVGKCTLFPDTEKRASKAMPSSQHARIYQEINALQIRTAGRGSRPITLAERDRLAEELLRPSRNNARLSFKKIRKLMSDMSDYDSFNLESDRRDYLVGDETAAKLMQKNAYGPSWFDLDFDVQESIVSLLVTAEDPEALITELIDVHGLSPEKAEALADCTLPDGHSNLSTKAHQALLPWLRADVTVYSVAVEQAGFKSHSNFATGEVFDKGLPYYGRVLERQVAFGSGDPKDLDEKRYGKVANPTVHVALNQVRAVVNDLIKRFGCPHEIVIELARDLPLSAKGKSELDKRLRDNRAANEKRGQLLRDIYKQPNTYANRMRLRLYEDLEALGKCCIYTGQHISAQMLFSDEVEVEHILPFSKTLDDGYANKTLSMRQANRDKGQRSPHEAFSHSPNGYDWEEISKRAASLPGNKKWRFSADAMERFEEDSGFLQRQLTDTQYISRLTKGYLDALYPGDNAAGGRANNVWVIPGRLTSDLRWNWGLDSVLAGHNADDAEAAVKNREDHRHHAIDAVVVACTDRSMLQQAAKQAKQNEQSGKGSLMAGTPAPWPSFRADVEKVVRDIIVSHKPDHGYQSAMHNDTSYGIVKGPDGEPDKSGKRTVVNRKPLDSDSFKGIGDLSKIRDPLIRETLEEATYGLTGKDFKEALVMTANAMKPPVYKVRITENLSVIPMYEKGANRDTERPIKAYKGDSNYCYDIWIGPKGKWVGEVISSFDAYQLAQADPNWWRQKKGRDGQTLIMRLRKGDYLELTDQTDKRIYQIYKFSVREINLAEHFEANASARIRAKELPSIRAPLSWLQERDACLVTVSPSGILTRHKPPKPRDD